MAKLPPEINETLWNLKRQLLDIMDSATEAEFIIFDRFGENDRTIYYLDQLKSISEQAEERFAQFCTVQRHLAKSQPRATRDLLNLLTEGINYTQARIPAWERSIQEIKLDWRLP